MPERLIDPHEVDSLVRPCIQGRAPVTFDAQPGWATCEACGVRQYLTEPSALYPAGGQGRERGVRAARAIATRLDHKHPRAAARPRERSKPCSPRRLGMPDPLARRLLHQRIESALSVVLLAVREQRGARGAQAERQL